MGGRASATPLDAVAELQAMVKPLKARVGLEAVMLDTGDSISLGGGVPYPMHSVVKFPLALSVLDRVDRGLLALDGKIRVTPEQLTPGTWSPLRDKFPKGGDFTLRELLRFSMQESDNHACDILFGLVGGPAAVQKDLERWGIKDISVKFTEAGMAADWNAQYANSARPSAMNALLKAFDEGKVLKEESRKVLWDMMASCTTGGGRLKGLLPGTWTVAHKTGTGGSRGVIAVSAVNDAGIIVLPDGRKMALTVFVMDSADPAPACERTIASLAHWLCTAWFGHLSGRDSV